MTLQLDMFAAGEADALPPWVDPAVCVQYGCAVETDRDHVGAEAVGRVGNNAPCVVVRAIGCAGETLRAWRFSGAQQTEAYDFIREQERKLARNRQAVLL
jgi:hypothetical protein